MADESDVLGMSAISNVRTTGALALGTALLMAPVASAETGTEVIERLQDQGYQVVLDRIGSKSLDQCVVTNIRNPQTLSRPPLRSERDDNQLTPVIIHQTITISLDCS